MTRKKKKLSGKRSISSTQQQISSGAENDPDRTESDDDEFLEAEKTFSFQISCKPYGSKLKKPTKYFEEALAKIATPICNEFRLKNVTYLKDNIFLVESSIKYLEGMSPIYLSRV